MQHTVYLLHFDKPRYSKTGRPFQHYVGYSSKLEERLNSHKRNNGARFVKWLQGEGSTFVVAKTEKYKTHGDARGVEILIKKRGVKNFCPCCYDRPRNFPKVSQTESA